MSLADRYTMKRYAFLLKYFFALGCVAWFLWRTDLSLVAIGFQKLSLMTIVCILLINVLSLAVNSEKWRLLLPDTSFRTLFATNLAGQFYATVFPGQLAGDSIKTYILGSAQKQVDTVAASVVVDKLTGLVGGVFILGFFGGLLSKEHFAHIALVVFGVGFFVFLCIFSLIRHSLTMNWLRSHIQSIASRYPKSEKYIRFALSILDTTRRYSESPWILVKSVCMGILYQLLGIVIIVLLTRDIGVSVGFFDWTWIVALLSVVLLVPITVAGLGLREGTLIGVTSLLGVPAHLALTVSLSLFGLQVCTAAFGGVVELNRIYKIHTS